MMMLFQLLLGVDVRESVDMIAREMGYAHRNTWIEKLDVSFWIHRSFSLLILGIHVLLVFMMKKHQNYISKLPYLVMILMTSHTLDVKMVCKCEEFIHCRISYISYKYNMHCK